jgi:hypothetical protein
MLVFLHLLLPRGTGAYMIDMVNRFTWITVDLSCENAVTQLMNL